VVILGGAGLISAADDPQAEFGLFAGWGVLDHLISGKGAAVGNGTPFLGLRGSYLLSDNVNLFGDLGLGELGNARGSVPGASFNVRETALRVGPEFLFSQSGKPSRFYVAPALGWSFFNYSGGGPAQPANFDRSFGSLGFGQRFLIGGDNVARWELRAEQSLSSSGLGGKGTTNYLALFGLGFGVPQKDSDHDGVVDRKDACPNTPAGAKVDARGCPTDSDGDGVFDGIDQCPDTPKGAKVDARGCPIDSDGDGVPDGIDQCPNTPKGAKVDARGCPIDTDGDGVFDGIDQCPDTPKGAKVDARGCPIDSDGDGVWDGIDQCPDTPKGVKVDAKGCPIAEPIKQNLVLEGVNFASDSDQLTPPSTMVLDKVVESLKAWPEVQVEIAGHTDSTNTKVHNQKLSDRRAASVKSYLVGRGVAAGRMTAKGYGASKPIVENKTPEGRAKNRRVELTRVN
jgi:outer membrane protein OmpA-like peptidoglycan-associated protein